MTKNELIHLHALLVCVAEDLLEDGPLDGADLDPYEALDVSPVAVRARRADHERAVLTLAAALSGAIAGEAADTGPAADRETDPEPAAQ